MSLLINLEMLDLSDNKMKIVPREIVAAMVNLKALSMIMNRFEVPESEIPEIVKRTHYGERNPEHAGNWRGRNNRPGANYVAYTVNDKKSEDDEHCSEEDELSCSDVEDDWDKEIVQSS